jgi:hypothetical protein
VEFFRDGCGGGPSFGSIIGWLIILCPSRRFMLRDRVWEVGVPGFVIGREDKAGDSGGVEGLPAMTDKDDTSRELSSE